MFENSTNLLSKWKGKWSGNELENDFLIASILGTEVYLNTSGLEEMNLNLDLSMEVNVNMLDQLILIGPVIRCQCYQHQWFFLIAVMYSIRLNCKYEHIL